MIPVGIVVKFSVLLMFAASAAYLHLRGQVRQPLARQLADHSTFLAPYNALVYLFSAVPRRPVLDPELLPEMAPIRANWHVIRQEALRLLEAGRIIPVDASEDIGFSSFVRHGWKRFYLKWYGATLPSALATCPETVRLLESVPSVKAALFAMLPPGGKLGGHRDPFAGVLRYHLGLSTPNSPSCRIYVDGNPLWWRDGEALVFDETYVHSAVNETDVPRIVLFCDVVRPLRTRVMRAVNAFVMRWLVPLTASRNEDDEPLGAVNRVAGYAFGTKKFFHRLKKRTDPRLYYGVKYGGAALLVWLLLFSGWVL
jgi:beta-hydroxylase